MLTGKKVLIFDLGGVVIDLFVDRTFAAMLALGVPAGMLTEQGCLMNSMMMKYDRGDVTTDEMFGYVKSFIPDQVRDSFAGRLDDELRRVWNLMLGNFAPEKLQRIKELRSAGYRIVMLSNTNEAHWPQVESLFIEAAGEPLESYFDSLHLSYRMRRRKPEPEIFLDLLAAENASPGDCIFFDDSDENCEVARSLGIDAVVVERNAPWDGILI